jgi:hypothetical protein
MGKLSSLTSPRAARTRDCGSIPSRDNSLQSVGTIFGADPASQRSGREDDHSSYITKIKLLPRSTANDHVASRDEDVIGNSLQKSDSLKILCCIIYKFQRPKHTQDILQWLLLKIKCAINKSNIKRIFLYKFNIANFSVILRKCNLAFSPLFQVSEFSCCSEHWTWRKCDSFPHVGKFKPSKN